MTRKRMTVFGCVSLAAVLLCPADASAQRRAVRVPARTSVFVGAGFGRPFFAPYYDPFWSPFWYDPAYLGWYQMYPGYPNYGYSGYWSAARV
ncbi:MAG TPA: hypothetical protein VGL62_13025, partial [Vicinamibacterales bacterium]